MCVSIQSSSHSVRSGEMSYQTIACRVYVGRTRAGKGPEAGRMNTMKLRNTMNYHCIATGISLPFLNVFFNGIRHSYGVVVAIAASLHRRSSWPVEDLIEAARKEEGLSWAGMNGGSIEVKCRRERAGEPFRPEIPLQGGETTPCHRAKGWNALRQQESASKWLDEEARAH